KWGIPYAQGQVKLVGKEVDYVLPSLEELFVMIMVSYMETTSSNQTTRANEQLAMYQKIVGENVRYPREQRVLVNVVDGAGWLARRSDLRKVYEGCHYCLNMRTLSQLETIVLSYVPRRFFPRG
ncbi:MAG: DpnII family type II restriction endonuclease, partial [Anaerolineales bacterium]